jgi:cysteine-rich repeat protein
MKETHEKNDLFLLSIVALVAIVGIVIMIFATNSGGLSSDDSAGQATKSVDSTTLSTRGYCNDDGVLNYYSRDSVVYSDGRKETVYTDFCINYNGTLREYYCNKGKVAYKSPLPSECPQGCLNGACINVSAVCGNAIVEPGEQCDDGNPLNTDTCNTLCQLTRCGDAIVQVPNGNGFMEQCDDGNSINTDSCYNNCTIAPVTPKADLYAEDILFINPYGNVTLNNSIGQGTSFYIVPRVKNTGNVSVYANSFYNRITFGSAYGTFSNYIRCSNSNNWPIAPGASFNCASDNIIRNLTIGTYPVSIGVDYYNNISESNENNNARTEVVYVVN